MEIGKDELSGSLAVFGEYLGRGAEEGMLPLPAVDVGDAGIPARGLDGFREEPCVSHAVLHYLAVAREAQMDEVVLFISLISLFYILPFPIY